MPKCLYVILSVCPSVHISKYLYVQVSICPGVYMSKCQYVPVSICPSVHVFRISKYMYVPVIITRSLPAYRFYNFHFFLIIIIYLFNIYLVITLNSIHFILMIHYLTCAPKLTFSFSYSYIPITINVNYVKASMVLTRADHLFIHNYMRSNIILEPILMVRTRLEHAFYCLCVCRFSQLSHTVSYNQIYTLKYLIIEY